MLQKIANNNGNGGSCAVLNKCIENIESDVGQIKSDICDIRIEQTEQNDRIKSLEDCKCQFNDIDTSSLSATGTVSASHVVAETVCGNTVTSCCANISQITSDQITVNGCDVTDLIDDVQTATSTANIADANASEALSNSEKALCCAVKADCKWIYSGWYMSPVTDIIQVKCAICITECEGYLQASTASHDVVYTGVMNVDTICGLERNCITNTITTCALSCDCNYMLICIPKDKDVLLKADGFRLHIDNTDSVTGNINVSWDNERSDWKIPFISKGSKYLYVPIQGLSCEQLVCCEKVYGGFEFTCYREIADINVVDCSEGILCLSKKKGSAIFGNVDTTEFKIQSDLSLDKISVECANIGCAVISCECVLSSHINDLCTDSIYNVGNFVNDGEMNVAGCTTLLGNLTVCADTVLQCNLTNCGNITNKGDFINECGFTNCGDSNLIGTTCVGGCLCVDGSQIVCGDLAVCGTTTISGFAADCVAVQSNNDDEECFITFSDKDCSIQSPACVHTNCKITFNPFCGTLCTCNIVISEMSSLGNLNACCGNIYGNLGVCCGLTVNCDICTLCNVNAEGYVKASCFCGKALDADCVYGCTYECLKSDFANGKVTIADSTSSSAVPVTLCTGATTVGKSGCCSFTFTPTTGTLCQTIGYASTRFLSPCGQFTTNIITPSIFPIQTASGTAANVSLYSRTSSASNLQVGVLCCNGLIYKRFWGQCSNTTYKVPFTSLTGTATAGTYTGFAFDQVDTENTFTYNPSTNTLTVGTVSGTATNATCFNGCTYACACANIRSGLTGCTGTVTISNSTSSSAVPLALCTGATAVGKSNTCSLTFVPSTGVLTAATFCGNVCGTATCAEKVFICYYYPTSTSVCCYGVPVFANGTCGTYTDLYSGPKFYRSTYCNGPIWFSETSAKHYSVSVNKSYICVYKVMGSSGQSFAVCNAKYNVNTRTFVMDVCVSGQGNSTSYELAFDWTSAYNYLVCQGYIDISYSGADISYTSWYKQCTTTSSGQNFTTLLLEDPSIAAKVCLYIWNGSGGTQVAGKWKIAAQIA